MVDRTYPELTPATDVQASDLVALYRAPGPLKKLTASEFADYVASATGAAMPTLTTFFEGQGRSVATPLNDYIRRRAIMLGTFTDAQLVALTTI